MPCCIRAARRGAIHRHMGCLQQAAGAEKAPENEVSGASHAPLAGSIQQAGGKGSLNALSTVKPYGPYAGQPSYAQRCGHRGSGTLPSSRQHGSHPCQ